LEDKKDICATLPYMAGETIPFRDWMQRALFDPQCGYYARQIRTVGRRGDFSTSATISNALGEAVAAWLRKEHQAQRDVRTIIEIGGGGGDLMHAVRRSLGWWGRWHYRFIMVEASPVLREAQQQKLSGSGVQWFEALSPALDTCQGKAFIHHNELLDAFPVTLVEWSAAEQAWQEIWLEAEGAEWNEQRRPLPVDLREGALYSVLEGWKPPYDKQRCELGADAQAWMQQWAPHWKAGAMLTLDYGAEFPQLYHRMPAGTLRAYQMHQSFTGPEIYGQMGRRDITADVNFTDLQRWGEALGWGNEKLLTQREFLQAQLPRFESRLARDPALRFLAEEHGAGGEFKALIQRPGTKKA
jgi:SAM-dependent MidA family methyltransferase